MPHTGASTKAITSETLLEIPFFDVDSLNVVWHGNYCKYFEVARCELLSKIGYDYASMRESGFAFPIVEMKIKYILPLRFQQRVCIRVELLEWEHRLRLDYRVSDQETQVVHTRATSTQAAVALGDQHLQLVCPKVFTDKVSRYIDTLHANETVDTAVRL